MVGAFYLVLGYSMPAAKCVDGPCGYLWDPSNCASYSCDCNGNTCLPAIEGLQGTWGYFSNPSGYKIYTDSGSELCEREYGCQPVAGLSCMGSDNLCKKTTTVLNEYFGDSYHYVEPQQGCGPPG